MNCPLCKEELRKLTYTAYCSKMVLNTNGEYITHYERSNYWVYQKIFVQPYRISISSGISYIYNDTFDTLIMKIPYEIPITDEASILKKVKTWITFS